MGERQPSLAVRLRQAESVLRDHLQPALDELGLTLDHWRIIAVLLEEPGLGMSALAAAAVVPNATLTRFVDTLTERGLVVRRLDRGDKRRAVAALSPHGTRLARRLRRQEDEVTESLVLGDLLPSGNT